MGKLIIYIIKYTQSHQRSQSTEEISKHFEVIGKYTGFHGEFLIVIYAGHEGWV